MQALIILLLILAILLVIFTLQNTMAITVHLFFWQVSNAPLALVVLVCVVIGYLLASLYFFPKIWKLKSERNRLAKANDKLLQKGSPASPGENENPDKQNPEGMELDDGDDRSFFTD